MTSVFFFFSFNTLYIIKQLLDLVFVISRIIKVSGRVISTSTLADSPYGLPSILDITKKPHPL